MDIKFTHNGLYYDISYKNGDIETIDNLETAILMSLYCEKRASPDEVSEPLRRRGHFSNLGNSVQGYERGCLLWLYTEQAINNDDTRNKILATVQAGLQWFVEDGIANNIECSFTSIEPLILRVDLFNKLNSTNEFYNIFIITFNNSQNIQLR